MFVILKSAYAGVYTKFVTKINPHLAFGKNNLFDTSFQ